MRQTSLDAYNAIRESNLLGKLQFEVYKVIVEHGPITQGEAWKGFFPNKQRHDVCPRFAELLKRGVIRTVGERPCKVTGRNSLIWASTNSLPVKTDKPQRHKCCSCGGKGYIEETQARLL